ncbi:MAG: ABC transporter substrate-binding protein [Elusimicrobiota bacterium]
MGLRTKSSKLSLVLALVLFTQCLPAVFAEEKITLTWWHFWGDETGKKAITELITKYQEINPGVQIVTKELTYDTGKEVISKAFFDNTAPDIIELGSDWVPEYSIKNLLLNITPAARDVEVDFKGWSYVTLEDKIYGFPWLLDTRVIFYNKALLKQAGFDPEKPPQTWPQFYNAIKKIDLLSRDTYGFGMNSRDKGILYKKLLAFIWSNNGLILSEDGKTCLIETRQVREALEYYLSLKPYSKVGPQRELDKAFYEGKLGFWLSGSWVIWRSAKVNPKLEYGVMLFPKPDKNGASTSWAGGQYLVINKNTKHAEQALDFVKFVVSKDAALYFAQSIGFLSPAAKEAMNDAYYQFQPERKKILEQLDTAKGSPAHLQWTYIQDILDNRFAEAIEDKLTANQAVISCKREIDEILKVLK